MGKKIKPATLKTGLRAKKNFGPSLLKIVSKLSAELEMNTSKEAKKIKTCNTRKRSYVPRCASGKKYLWICSFDHCWSQSPPNYQGRALSIKLLLTNSLDNCYLKLSPIYQSEKKDGILTMGKKFWRQQRVKTNLRAEMIFGQKAPLSMPFQTLLVEIALKP